MDSEELVNRWRRLPAEKRGNFWWRCDEPERPTDPMVRWHYDGCRNCRFAVQMLELDPDLTEWERDRVNALAGRMDDASD